MAQFLAVDPTCTALYSGRMSDKANTQAKELDLGTLETRIDELINACGSLKSENNSLRNQQGSLVNERSNLIQKTELARTRVEAMISRLKAMEHEA